MILVLCGTQKQDFSRMLAEVEKLAPNNRIVVQLGHTDFYSDKMELFDFMAHDKLKLLYDQAKVIMTHAGAGSMFTAIEKRKKTLVFPRLQKYNEHVDDHQLQLAEKLAELGYLLVFNDGDDIFELFELLFQTEFKDYSLKGDLKYRINCTLKHKLL